MGTRMTLKHVLPLSSSLTWTSSDFQNAANISRTDSCISTSISRSFTCCAIFKTCQIHRKGSIKRCVPQRRSFELQQRKHREDCRVSQIGRQRGRTWASYHQEHTSHSLGRKCLAAPVGLVQTNFQKLCVNLGDRNPSTRTPAEMRMRATSMIHYKMTLAMLNLLNSEDVLHTMTEESVLETSSIRVSMVFPYGAIWISTLKSHGSMRPGHQKDKSYFG